MITGDIKNQIDRIWDSFWSGGISNSTLSSRLCSITLFVGNCPVRPTGKGNL